jgi:hypothetical protein|eukprot:CAMPEP_0174303070 /NCGR_PEP_ID=MMETSP0809-20121228/59969_1 /TAXON_ID=73025 ORGANISM="Eutreptiella gymnastica-like, Strain CCMP1594" /NCGR_SAMPLE_ID=MMETSP0809 /ASSEMBLY_ACC=CAM_ASM_000658 /LENGTH=370 /DNA_ID=CAMNT_0015409035 /DNA_START=29 /DNA_END=1141 /DNA_ORIENTATION=-
MAEQPAAEAKYYYQRVQEGIEAAHARINEVRERIKEFDAKQQASNAVETASQYFASAIDAAQEALGDLGKTTQEWKETASEVPIRALSSAFQRLCQALAELTDRAKQYDEKYQLSASVSAAIADPRKQAYLAAAAASSAVTAQLQWVSDELKVRIVSAADFGLEKAMPAAVAADQKLCLTEKVTVAHDLVIRRAKEMDERYSMSQYCNSALGAVQGLDHRVTGGKVEPAMTSAYELGLQMLGYILSKYEEAKKTDEVELAAELPKKVLQQAPQQAAEAPKEVPVEAPRDVAVEARKEVPVEVPKEVPVEAPKELPIEAPEVLTEPPQEVEASAVSKDPTKEVTAKKHAKKKAHREKAAKGAPSSGPAGTA